MAVERKLMNFCLSFKGFHRFTGIFFHVYPSNVNESVELIF